MNAKLMWSRRVSGFRQEIRPYLTYALRTLSFASLFIMIISAYLYVRFLEQIRPGYPALLTAALVLLPVLALTPVRTYLRAPDIVYLLPLEDQLGEYFRAARRRAFVIQAFVTTVAWFILRPLLELSDSAIKHQFLAGLLLLLVLKRVLLHAKWLELHIYDAESSRLWGIVRWAVTGALTFALLKLPLSLGSLLLAAGATFYLLVLTTAARAYRHLPWLKLVELEQRHRAFAFRMLNLFIDVPAVQGKARRNPAPRRLARYLGYRSSRAGIYLYLLVWYRSEASGIWLRLTSLGAVLTGLSGGGLPGYALWGLFAVVIAVQLAELQKMRHISEHACMYPLPHELFARSARLVRFGLHALSLLVLSFLFAVSSGASGEAIILLVIGLGCSGLYHHRKATPF
ncbi:MAG TPA: ABC transporter permease [Bacilli bacterium]